MPSFPLPKQDRADSGTTKLYSTNHSRLPSCSPCKSIGRASSLSGEVATWNFESWNEPDHGDFGSSLGNVTLDGYLNYYDATAAGIIKGGLDRLRLGGPGGSCRSPKFIRFCHGLIEHCTGYAPSRIYTRAVSNPSLTF